MNSQQKHTHPMCILVIVWVVVLGFGCEDDIVPKTQNTCDIDIDTIDFTFGIQYDQPERYLNPGDQSDLNDSFFVEIKEALGELSDGLDGVLEACEWMNQNFTFENAGGNMIGIPTVNDLFERKEFYGCHSAALIISSVLRKYGYPTIMIETASVQWAYDYHAGRTRSFSGHVMSEVYVLEEWILLDNNCAYVQNYDPTNPFISTPNYNPDDYFVYAKGLDTWDYSDRQEGFTHTSMEHFAENIYCFEELFDTIEYTWNQ